MGSLGQYLGGILLCWLVSLVYSLARKDTASVTLKETMLVFVYTMGAIAAVVLVVLLACKFK